MELIYVKDALGLHSEDSGAQDLSQETLYRWYIQDFGSGSRLWEMVCIFRTLARISPIRDTIWTAYLGPGLVSHQQEILYRWCISDLGEDLTYRRYYIGDIFRTWTSTLPIEILYKWYIQDLGQDLTYRRYYIGDIFRTWTSTLPIEILYKWYIQDLGQDLTYRRYYIGDIFRIWTSTLPIEILHKWCIQDLGQDLTYMR